MQKKPASDRPVALVNPPWQHNGRSGIRAGSRWPYTVEERRWDETVPFPFFLACTAALLEEHGFASTVLDGIALGLTEERFHNELRRLEPGVVIFETSTPSFSADVAIADRIRRELPDAIVVLCGPQASLLPEETLRRCGSADYVFIGEYEETALEFVRARAAGSDPRSLPGLAFRADDGITVNPRRPLIADLDTLPFPKRDAISLYKYNEWCCGVRPNAQIIASRGCLYACPFCMWPPALYGGQNYRIRSAGNVVDEIEYLFTQYGIRHFYFDDDTFNLKTDATMNLCEEIIRRDLPIEWDAMCHAATLDEPLLRRMRDAGCRGVKIGVETGNEPMLKALGKGLTLQQVRTAFAACRTLGIRTHASFALGLPGETEETVRQTQRFIFELEPTTIQVSIITPFPGTPLHARASREGWLATDDWSCYDGAGTAVLRTSRLTEEDLERARQETIAMWDAWLYEKDLRTKPALLLKKCITRPRKAARCAVSTVRRLLLRAGSPDRG